MIDWLADRLAARDLPTETTWSLAFSRRATAGHLDFASLLARRLFARPIRMMRQLSGMP
ncbi:hypothetical protein ACFWF7_30870 [Nocardia sp. NPDC060256]|uniref:hypothetical protein n=1 Tax=unclassified Nocardia TaxID=2637762 RepID=UPI0036622ED0